MRTRLWKDTRLSVADGRTECRLTSHTAEGGAKSGHECDRHWGLGRGRLEVIGDERAGIGFFRTNRGTDKLLNSPGRVWCRLTDPYLLIDTKACLSSNENQDTGIEEAVFLRISTLMLWSIQRAASVLV